ncbi:50S ribosomal protein L9 [Patescibacteria group bacterium]|nr:50S ribosomal protein L9 [Patescibacteria group bacterium]
MKVILLQDIDKLGKKGDIKEVADGYARNLLIPNKKAVLASKSEIIKAEEQKKIDTEKAEQELIRFQEVASQLDGFELEIPAKVGEDNKLFGAITTVKISEELKKNNFEIEKNKIKLEEPIKEIGEYEIPIELPHNLEAKIKLIVTEEK